MKQINRIAYGGDYNPNQWPEDEWQGDLEWFEKAHINSVTLNVFSWARLQPAEKVYDFGQLDRMIELYASAGFDIVLATSTAAMPAWMVKKYPEMTRVDFEGRKHKFGQRHNACPNSPVYQRFAREMAGRLAQRYGGNPAVKLWHINNEYSGACFCENCEKAFRLWLKDRYQTLDILNAAWNTEFWGHTIGDWDEIVAPNRISEASSKKESAFEGLSVDYRRFTSQSMLNNFCMERDAIRKHDKETPVTTNLMGTYKTMNYHLWGREMDVVSWDNYPTDAQPASQTAMRHALMRGLKDGQSFWIMEQNPTQQTYESITRKAPGKMRAWSYQALAHGADALLYFQLKNSIGASEKYCGSVIGHAGHGNTRVFREVAALGEEMNRMSSHFLGARLHSQVAVVYDWESYWALDYDRYRGTNRDLDYIEAVHHHYSYFHRNHIQADFISPKADFSRYRLIIAPALYMVGKKLQEALQNYVRQGGFLVATYMSGMVDESTNIIPGGYPGALRDMAGIWVEENDYLDQATPNRIAFEDGAVYICGQSCDIIHLQGAQAMASYTDDGFFYCGYPAITRNEYGKGTAWYLGTRLEQDGLETFFNQVCGQLNIAPLLEAQKGLEVTKRSLSDKAFYFVINHEKEAKQLPMALAGCVDIITGQRLEASRLLNQYDVVVAQSAEER